MYSLRLVPLVLLAMAAAVSAGSQSAAMPPLPVTQLDVPRIDPDLDGPRMTLAFVKQTPIHDVLLLLVRDTRLSVVPDPSLTQSFVGDLKNVTLREAFDLIFEPLGLDYSVRGRVVRVFPRALDTRFYNIDYVLPRSGSSSDVPNLYEDVSDAVRALLSENGRMSLNRTAAMLQVTDTPTRLARVEAYLEAAMLRATRQVQIEAKIIEVDLRDESSTGIDWRAVQSSVANSTTAAQTFVTPASDGLALALKPAGFTSLISALAAQGTVNVLSSPLITAMNNEPAVMRIRTSDSQALPESMTLRVTAQISAEGIIHLSVNPIVSAREADTLVRVRQGETIVIAGLMQERSIAGAGTPTRRKTDLVILLTPTLIAPARAR